VWALTADADFLAQRGQGQVETGLCQSGKYRTPGSPAVADAALWKSNDNAPNSCRLALTHFDDLFRHGDKVQFDDQGITVGQHLHIEMSRCRRWLSPTLQMTAVNFHLIRLATVGTTLFISTWGKMKPCLIIAAIIRFIRR